MTLVNKHPIYSSKAGQMLSLTGLKHYQVMFPISCLNIKNILHKV